MKFRMDVSRLLGEGVDGVVFASSLREAVDVATKFAEGIMAAGWRAAPDGEDAVVLLPLVGDAAMATAIDLVGGFLDDVHKHDDGRMLREHAEVLAAHGDVLSKKEMVALVARFANSVCFDSLGRLFSVGGLSDEPAYYRCKTRADAVMAVNALLAMSNVGSVAAALGDDNDTIVVKPLADMPPVWIRRRDENGMAVMYACFEDSKGEMDEGE